MTGTKKFFNKQHPILLRALAAFTILATVCTLIMPAVALSKQATYCNMEEHTHDEQCQEECPIPEHLHSRQCESNPDADVEEEADWTVAFEAIREKKASPSKAVQIALSQVGTRQSSTNFLVLEDGQEAGYSRYGAWENEPYRQDMQESFIRFVYSYAGAYIGAFENTTVADWFDKFVTGGLLHDVSRTTPGSLAFIEDDGLKAAVVVDSSDESVTVVEVSHGQVQKNSVGKADFYGSVPVLRPSSIEVMEEPKSALPMALTEDGSDFTDESEVPLGNRKTVVPVLPNSLVARPASVCPETSFPDANPSGTEGEEGYDPHKTVARFYYRYPAGGSQTPKEWTLINPENDLTFAMNAEFKMEVNYENLSYQGIEDANHEFTYPIPPFMKSTLTSQGIPLEHTFESSTGEVRKITIGELTPCGSGSHLHINYSNYEQLEGQDIVEGKFEFSLGAVREMIWDQPEQSFAVGDEKYTFKFDTSTSYEDVVVNNFQKAKNPTSGNQNLTFDENGNIVIKYQIYFDVANNPAPDAIVDDWFGEGSSLPADLLSKVVPYQNIQFESRPKGSNNWQRQDLDERNYIVDLTKTNDPVILRYQPTIPANTEFVEHEVPKLGFPRASFYLGTLSPDNYYRITYTCTYPREARDELTSNERIRNWSRISFGTRKNAEDDYEDQDVVNERTVNKAVLDDLTRQDEDGNLYFTYKISLVAGANNFDDWITGGKIYDFMNVKFNRELNQDYLQYLSLESMQNSSDDQTYSDVDISDITHTDNGEGSRIFPLPCPETLAPGEKYYVKVVIKVDRELAVKMTVENKEECTLDNLAYTHEPYAASNPHSGTVSKTIGHSEIVKKAKGDLLEEDTTVDLNGDVYDQDGNRLTDVSSFVLPEKSIEYSIRINEDGKADVQSSDLNDALTVDGSISDRFGFTGYAALELYDGRQEEGKASIGTIWIKLPEDSNQFNLALNRYHDSIERLKKENNVQHALSYRLRYYVKTLDGADNLVLTNGLTGGVGVGVGGSVVQAKQNVTVSSLIVRGKEISAKKRGIYYLNSEADHDENGVWKNGRLIWMVELSGSSISKNSVFTDTLQQVGGVDNYISSFVPGQSVIGIYRGLFDFNYQFTTTNPSEGGASHSETSFTAGNYPTYSYQDFENALHTSTVPVDENLYTVTYGSGNKTLSLQFKENYDLEDENGALQKLYILLQSTPSNKTGGSSTDLTWKHDYYDFKTSNQFAVAQGSETKTLASSRFNYRSYYTVSKDYGCAFTYEDDQYKQMSNLGNLNNWTEVFNRELTPILNSKIESGELSSNTLFDHWIIDGNVQKDGSTDIKYHPPFTGTFKVVDTLSDNMTFVAAFLDQTGDNLPTIESIQVEGQKITILVGNVDSHQSFRIHLISKLNVPWDQVISQNTTMRRSNHVDLYHDDVRLGFDDEALNNGFKNAMSKASPTLGTGSGSVSLSGTSKIQYTIGVNPNRVDLIQNSDVLDLKDTYDPNVIEILPDTFAITADEVPYNDYTVEFRKEEGQVIVRNLPDNKKLNVQYDAALKALPSDTAFEIGNNCTWMGYGMSAPTSSYSHMATNSIGGSSSSVELKPQVTLTKVDANNAKVGLPGAKFEFIPGTVESGAFVADDANKIAAVTNEAGQIVFNNGTAVKLKQNTWYKVVETEVPSGYDVLSIEPAQYFYVYKNAESFPAENNRPTDGKVSLSPLEADTVLYLTFTNKKPVFSIEVNKTFTKNGLLPGAYTFAVFDEEYDPSSTEEQKPLKKVTLNITPEQAAGSQTSAKVTIDNLTIREKPYYVYELNDEGVPTGRFLSDTSSGQLYEVIYPESGNAVTYVLSDPNTPEDQRKAEFAVRNKPVYELPETGGEGIALLYGAGTSLMTIGSVLVWRRKRKGSR